MNLGFNRKKKVESVKTTNLYPYMFQTSGFSAIDRIRAEIESQTHWDYAPTGEASIKFQVAAAKRYGISAPYSKEQFALLKILYVNRAGRNISTYAWGLYAQSCKHAKIYA